MSADDPEEYIVISSWASEDDWNAWLNNDSRRSVQARIDNLLGTRTMYQVYFNA